MDQTCTEPPSVILSPNNAIWPKSLKMINSKHLPNDVAERMGHDATGPTPQKSQGTLIGGTFDEMTKQILKAVFTCQISKLPTQLFDNDNFISVSRTTLPFKHCKKNSSDISSCVEQLQRACLRSKYVLTKCVKLQSDAILGIKEDFPDLKIVHMIRDPRATLNSRKRLRAIGGANVSMHVIEFCNKVSYDTRIFKLLKRVYPTDVFTVYHNSFESNPLLFSRKLFTALNLPLNPTVEKRLEELTSKKIDCTRNHYVCTSKYNTADAVSEWRREIEFSFVKVVDSLCRNVYRAHGFLPFESPVTAKKFNISITELSFDYPLKHARTYVSEKDIPHRPCLDISKSQKEMFTYINLNEV
ncbi:hypothetical protein FSP39_009111 [Pinctada imbricata]|uniref:Uncharacterized protein n=1 Tax=Pinctada imbricata TaxID=66713 RepID=A0AA88XUT4_PINIB|nr:hypothetical protein FSP39_009111 [Pinctada imbricata]